MLAFLRFFVLRTHVSPLSSYTGRTNNNKPRRVDARRSPSVVSSMSVAPRANTRSSFAEGRELVVSEKLDKRNAIAPRAGRIARITDGPRSYDNTRCHPRQRDATSPTHTRARENARQRYNPKSTGLNVSHEIPGRKSDPTFWDPSRRRAVLAVPLAPFHSFRLTQPAASS